MKRWAITLLALTAFPLLGAAQNRQIEEMAERYADREGYSVTVIKGSLVSELPQTMDLGGIDISNVIKNISSIILIRSELPDEKFKADIRRAVEAVDYRTITSASTDGESIKIMLADISGRRGEEKQNELVITVLGRKTNMLISVVGRYNVKEVNKTK